MSPRDMLLCAWRMRWQGLQRLGVPMLKDTINSRQYVNEKQHQRKAQVKGKGRVVRVQNYQGMEAQQRWNVSYAEAAGGKGNGWDKGYL